MLRWHCRACSLIVRLPSVAAVNDPFPRAVLLIENPRALRVVLRLQQRTRLALPLVMPHDDLRVRVVVSGLAFSFPFL